MSSRGSQEEKFKNIVLKVEPARAHSPDTHTSNLIKPTNSPNKHPNPARTPINIFKYLAKDAASPAEQANLRQEHPIL